ncbi:MAG: tRNA epoxyqueuosine(34) reductase QueG, partial [Armatimonadota bacterium]
GSPWLLAEFIRNKFPDIKLDISVDGNLPERFLAIESGIGWRGKNTQIYVNNFGSYVCLGEIVVNIEIPFDTPKYEDYCNDCTICINSCPTGAILPGKLLDSKKCLSYITQRGLFIPKEFRALIENRLYGCDICQDVCPHNQKISNTTPDFALDIYPISNPDMEYFLNLSISEFELNVKHTSIGWIGYNKIRRNAIIAAGNLKLISAVPSLVKLLNDSNPIIREHSAWALGQIGSSDAVNALEKRLEIENDKEAINTITEIISNFQKK